MCNGNKSLSCAADASETDCVCAAYCERDFTAEYDFAKDGIEVDHVGVTAVEYDWFAWFRYEWQTIPVREVILTISADLACSKSTLQEKKNACFKDPARDCSAIYTAWQKAEQCTDGMIADASKCYKTCQWWNGEYPPRQFLKRMSRFIVAPMCLLVCFVSFFRFFSLTLRCCHTMREEKHAMQYMTLEKEVGRDIHPRRRDDSDSDGSERIRREV
jgi:hypothetical protein